MELNREIKIPGIGGMNLDVIDLLLKPNDTRMIRNGIRIGYNEKNGSISNIKGNVEVLNPITLPLNPVVVGACSDLENNAVIYCIAGSDTSGIFRYFNTDNVIQKIYADPLLNFIPEVLVFCDVIDGLLYFSSANNEPRKLNIDKAYKYSNSISGGYTAIDRQVLDAIKYPPTFPPTCEYYTDTAVTQNNLRNRLFQFRYAYVYDDKEISKTSPVSKVPLPVDDISWDGEIVGNLQKNNVIKITLATGHEIVEKIKLYVREGNIGLWALVEIIDKAKLDLANDSYYVYNYINNRSEIVENQADIERLYDRVPLFADTQEYIHTNNLIYGGNTEWYPDEEIDVSLAAVASEVSVISSGGTEVYEYDSTPIELTGGALFTLTQAPTYANIITITITNVPLSLSKSENYFVAQDWTSSAGAFALKLKSVINNDFGSLRVVATVDNTNELTVEHVRQDEITATIIEYEAATGAYSKFTTFKSGARHPFGIVYYDRANRSNNVSVSEDTNIYLPFITEDPQPFNHTFWRYGINWQINSIPPIWATHYQWVYGKNQDIASWTQYLIKSAIASADSRRLLIDLDYQNQIANSANTYANYFPNTIIRPYEFTKGDRIRFITKTKSDFTVTPGLNELVDTYVDLEILGYELDSEGVETSKIIVQYINNSTIGNNTLAEIYTPKKQTQEVIFYEIGEVYEILDPGLSTRRHAGPVDQVLSPASPASGTFSAGDSYLIPRAFVVNLDDGGSIPQTPFVESMSFSDFAELNVFNYGRPNIIIEDVITEKRKSLLASGKYFQDTEINELCRFDGLQGIRVSDKFGDITYIEEKGYTLKVFQRNKVNSIYVGKSVIKQADINNNDILSASEKLLGSSEPSSTPHGSVDPFAIVTVERNTYFYDHLNQCICRDDPNGIDDIGTKYGFGFGIKEIADKLDTDCIDRHISAGYNPKYKEIIFTFTGRLKDPDSESYWTETITFKEDSNIFSNAWDWKNNVGHGPEYYFSIGNSFISFLNGKLWKHNINNIFNRFFEENYPIIIDLVFNINPDKLKIYKTLLLDGNGDWECPEFDDIFISENHSSNHRPMKSRLNKTKFKSIQGGKWATFMKNALTSNNEPNLSNLHNGIDMSGKILNLRLKCYDTSPAQVNSITILFQISNIS